MTEKPHREADRLQVGLFGRVLRGALVTWAVLLLAALWAGWRAAAGVGLGGGLSLGLLMLHWALVKAWLAPAGRGRRRMVAFWAVWVAKWPALATGLYLAVRGEWVSPSWLCVGVGLVPGVVTAVALRAAVVDGRRGRAAAEAQW